MQPDLRMKGIRRPWRCNQEKRNGKEKEKGGGGGEGEKRGVEVLDTEFTSLTT